MVFFVLDDSKPFDNDFWDFEMTTFQDFNGCDIPVTIGDTDLWQEDPRSSWKSVYN
jgi:hypothetical protein